MNTESTYETENISIKSAMDDMGHGRYVIPLIQRDFVWPMDKIEFLFDSILIGYPINALLLCPINDSDDSNKYYKFQNQIGYGMEIGNADSNAQFSVLDGQQRLTSIYSSLMEDGMYSTKKKSTRTNDTDDWHLYLNLTHPYSDIADKINKTSEEIPQYCIQFFKNTDKNLFIDENGLWIRFSTIYIKLDGNEDLENIIKRKPSAEEVNLAKDTAKELVKNIFFTYFAEQSQTHEFENIFQYVMEDFSYETLYLCYIRFFFDDILNCISLKKDSISDNTPMEIFIRLNKGVPLSYSNLLLTRLTSCFQTANKGKKDYTRDAKRRIKIDIINNISDTICKKDRNGFKPDTENILKTFLVINSCEKAKTNQSGNSNALYSDIGFENIEKIDNNVLKFINDKWKKISDTILEVYDLVWNDLELSNRGKYSRYSFIPLVMFFWLCEIDSKTKVDNLSLQTKQEIKWYLISARMNTVFSGAADTILARICKQIHQSYNNISEHGYDSSKYPSLADAVFDDFYKFISKNQIGSTDFTITIDKINNWINTYQKKNEQTYILLSLLYPDEAEPSKNTEVDHIHPKTPNTPYPKDLERNINGLWNCRLLVKNNPNGKKGNASKGNTPLIELYDADSYFKDLLLSEEEIKKIKNAYINNNAENLLSVKKWKDFRADREKNLTEYLTAILISDDCSKMPIKGRRPKLD